MRHRLTTLCMLLGATTPALAQLSLNFATPGVSIGINVPVYPTLQRVPGYPVYYAPGLNSNYFFYDGMYWVYQSDAWYASSWYNGPWAPVDPFYVPAYVLRVPVRYYRHAPAYFHGWRADAAPRWGEHWGSSWEQKRSGWDQWNHGSVPAPAPLPIYQRQYSGNKYPQQSQQAVIQTRSYRYQPAEPVAQQHYEHVRTQAQSAPPPQHQAAPQYQQHASPQPQAAPQQHASPQREQAQPQAQKQPPAPQARSPQQAPAAHESQAQAPQHAQQGKGQDKEQDKDKGKGHEKDDKDKGHGG